MIESFSNLINQYFKQKKTIPEFVRENYSPHEYATKDRTIRRYLSGEVVPQYHAAKELVEKLDIEISENELMEILNYSRTERETNIDYKHSYPPGQPTCSRTPIIWSMKYRICSLKE